MHKILSKIIKVLINLWYVTDKDNENLISWEIGTKYDDHDFTVIINRY